MIKNPQDANPPISSTRVREKVTMADCTHRTLSCGIYPCGQYKQSKIEAFPDVGIYVPSGQSIHPDVIFTGGSGYGYIPSLYPTFPMGQDTHKEASYNPYDDEYRPTGQVWQADMASMPVRLLYVPMGQDVHDADVF